MTKNEQKEIFIQRLHQAMDQANMNQVDIVKRTGISDSQMSQYCNGYCMPKQKNIFLISQALNVSPSWLIGLDQDEPMLKSSVQDLYDRLSDARKVEALEYLLKLQLEDNPKT